MSHLSDDLIYTLAVKVANESDLTLEEEKALPQNKLLSKEKELNQ